MNSKSRKISGWKEKLVILRVISVDQYSVAVAAFVASVVLWFLLLLFSRYVFHQRRPLIPRYHRMS